MFKPTTAPQDALILQLVPIVIQACEILRAEYQAYVAGGDFTVERKSDHSPVTQADYRVNQFITDALNNTFPHLPVLSEEGQHAHRQQWQSFWMLDPLDGTKEFLHQRPEFTINLSLIEGAHTTFAVLAIPCEQQIYFCPLQGQPLKYNIEKDVWSEYVPVENHSAVQVGLSQSSQNKPQYQVYLEQLENLTPIQEYRAGSAYKFCMVLEDRVDIYPRFHPTSEWDTSAGQCLLERIGGGLVDFQGRPFVYNQRLSLLNGGFIAYRNNDMKKLALQALELMPSSA